MVIEEPIKIKQKSASGTQGHNSHVCEEVDGYLHYVKDPMELERMHIKLDDGEYSCAQIGLNRL